MSAELRPDRVDPTTGRPAPVEFGRTQLDLERWRAGDVRAFEDIWSRYRPALEVMLFGRLRSRLEPAIAARLEVDDILQDVAVVVWNRLAGYDYRGPGSMLAWMTRIVTLVLEDWVDYWRAGKRHPRQELSFLPFPETRPTGGVLAGLRDTGAGPVTASDLGERRRRVAAALASLPDRYHTMLFLRFFGGAEWAEIAEELGSPSADAVRMECRTKALPALAAAMVAAERVAHADGGRRRHG